MANFRPKLPPTNFVNRIPHQIGNASRLAEVTKNLAGKLMVVSPDEAPLCYLRENMTSFVRPFF